MAAKATVHANRFSSPKKIRQAEAHHAFETKRTKAFGSRSKNSTPAALRCRVSAERTVIAGDSAIISSRERFGPFLSLLAGFKKKLNVSGNVKATVYRDADKAASVGPEKKAAPKKGRSL